MNALEIKQARKKIGLTQSKFANLLGVSLGAVQQWESGNRNITASTAFMIENIVSKQSKQGASSISGESEEFAKIEYLSEEDYLSEIDKIEDESTRSIIRSNAIKLYREIERVKGKMRVAMDILDGKK